ncbi:MAG: alpha/beta hydrolase [Ferruginibacter sp.]
MKVYFISGLAADSRVFKHIQLPPGFETVYLDWIQPHKKESLQSYALRLAEKISPHEKFILIGLSMGGMIASEIAKRYKPVATILVSSASTYRQFPGRFRVAYFFRLHKFVPPNFFKSTSLIKRFFTTESPDDKKIIRQIIKDSDPAFIKWALGAILRWRNEEQPESLWHIHGTRDEVLPFKKTNPTHSIHQGTHLMVMSKAAELNKLLLEVLTTAAKKK